MASAASHPGLVLQHEFMAPLGLSVADLAQAFNLPDEVIQGLLCGDRQIDVSTARLLAERFDTSVGFWSNLQADYDRRRG